MCEKGKNSGFRAALGTNCKIDLHKSFQVNVMICSYPILSEEQNTVLDYVAVDISETRHYQCVVFTQAALQS